MGEKKSFQVVLARTVHQRSRPIIIKAEDEHAASRIAVCDDTVEFTKTNVETEVQSILEIEDQNTADNPKEVEFAQRLAQSEPGHNAPFCLAEAVVNCTNHEIVLAKDNVMFHYDNSYGPVAIISALIGRMTMKDWSQCCDSFCELMLQKDGLDPNQFDWPEPHPMVKTFPQEGRPDLRSGVSLTFTVDHRTYQHLMAIVDKENG